jgi:hypothetical protein
MEIISTLYLIILLQHEKTMYYYLFSVYMQHFLYK